MNLYQWSAGNAEPRPGEREIGIQNCGILHKTGPLKNHTPKPKKQKTQQVTPETLSRKPSTVAIRSDNAQSRESGKEDKYLKNRLRSIKRMHGKEGKYQRQN